MSLTLRLDSHKLALLLLSLLSLLLSLFSLILLCNPLQYSSKDLLQMESNFSSGINGLHFQSMRLVDDSLD